RKFDLDPGIAYADGLARVSDHYRRGLRARGESKEMTLFAIGFEINQKPFDRPGRVIRGAAPPRQRAHLSGRRRAVGVGYSEPRRVVESRRLADRNSDRDWQRGVTDVDRNSDWPGLCL